MKGKLSSCLLISVLVVYLLLTGCEKKSHTGAAVGGAVGAGVGQVAGGDTKSTLLGGAIGAGAGYLIGRHQDKKEVEENPDDFVTIPITNDDGTTKTIALRKVNGGYVGPEGEYYDELPTREKLEEKYRD